MGLHLWGGSQNSKMPPGFPPLGRNTLCDTLVLSMDKTRGHNELLSWSGYVTWQTCKNFADVIKVPNQLTESGVLS